jgi:autotransporter-associated beta strand protein
MPGSSMIHFTNPMNVGSGSSRYLRFYYEDGTTWSGAPDGYLLDPALVGHAENAVFDVTGSISGSNDIYIDKNAYGNRPAGAPVGNYATFTAWLQGDNSGYSGRFTVGNDTGTSYNPGRAAVLRLGNVLALGTNTAVGFRNGGTLQLAGLDYTTDKSFLFTGGAGLATTAAIENGSDTPVTLTLNSILTGTSYQDVGVGIRDGSAFGYFGSGTAPISVVKTGSGNTVFGASTGGATPGAFSSYTGTTTVSEGILGAGSNYSFSPYSRFIVADGATLSAGSQGIGYLNEIGSLVGTSGASLDIDGSYGFTVGGDNTNDAVFAGVISGTGAFYKTGGGTQTLSGSSTWTGDAGVLQGTLIGTTNNAFGNGTNAIYLGGNFDPAGVVDAKVELLLAGTASAVTNPVRMSAFNGNDQGITVIGTRETSGNYGFGTGGTVALYQDVATNVFFQAEGSSVFTFADAVTNAGSTAVTNVVKIGTGTVELKAANSYGKYGTVGTGIDGGTVVRAGTIALFNSAALGNTVLELGDTVIPLTLDADYATTRSMLATAVGGTFDPASDGAGGAGAGAFLNVKAEVDGVALTGTDIGKRILIKDEGTDPERNGVYTVVSVDETCGTMTLTRASDFDESTEMVYGTSVGVTGGTTLAGTRYFVGNTDVAAVNGDGTDPVHWLPEVVNPNVALLAAASGLTITNGIDINDTNGTGTTTLGGTFTTGSSTFSGDITLQTSGLTGVDNVRELIMTSASNDLNIDGQAGMVFTGAITDAPTEPGGGDVLSLTKVGTGTTTLTSAGNTYNGKTTITEGTLALEGSGTIDTTNWVEINAGATFDTSALTSGTYTMSQPVSGSGTLNAGTGTITIGTSGGTGSLSPGMASDPTNIGTAGDQIGAITVNGSLTLAGDTVGTSRLNLQLGGTTAADLNAASDFAAHLAIGDFDTWILTQGSTYNAATSGNHDRLAVDGTLSLSSGGQITVTNDNSYSIQFGDIFNLLDWTTLNINDFTYGGTVRSGGLVGDLTLPTLGDNLFYDTSLFATYGIVTVVPEPGRLLLLLVGLSAVMFRRQRRSSRLV